MLQFSCSQLLIWLSGFQSERSKKRGKISNLGMVRLIILGVFFLMRIKNVCLKQDFQYVYI